MSELSEKCQTSSVNSAGSSSSSHSTSSKSLGVHKFCSKLRHKIEDNLNLNSARLTNKLRKSSRHSMSMSALSGIADATTGKYTANKSTTKTKTLQLPTIKQTSGMLKYKRVVKKSAEQKTAQKAEGLSFDTATTHKEIDSSVYVDSDDEYQLPSLSWTKQSLEDEIFEELEKAAHDENKLNSVLKSFDRILTDFQDEAVKPTQINANETETIKREIPHKLSKARTTLCEQNLPKKLSTTSKLNKSVLDVANTPTIMPVASKIPIWKALPLSKRSKSFCNAPVLETAQKPLAVQPKNISMGSRAISYTTLPRLKQTQRATLKNNYNNNNSNKLVKSKTELNVKTKPQQQQQQQNRNKSSNLRSHTNSDELLDKCLEKGQQILRKIETLGEQGARLQAVTKNTVNKSTQQKDTVKYLAEKGRQNSDALSDDSGHISNEADVQQTTSGLCESSSSTLESLCDIETDTTQLTTTMSTPRSTKIIELLQKFENTAKLNVKAFSATTTAMSANIKKSNSIKSAETTTTTTNTALATANKLNTQFTQNICTSLKVSEVEPVHCVQTHIEIFPNYSKEVTTWFY